jgi:hypothetical protein
MIIDIRILATALNDSIRHYNDILEYLIGMDREIGNASDLQLQAMSDTLCALQSQARKIDQGLLPQLTGDLASDKVLGPLLVAREKVLLEVIRKNSQISEKAVRSKSVLASELLALRQGQTALSGYKLQQYTGGGIVDSTS